MNTKSRQKYSMRFCKCCAAMEMIAVGLNTCDACIEYAVKYGRRNRAKGLCISCKRPAVDGKSRCAYHLKYHREYKQLDKQECIRLGLCIDCRTPVAPGEIGHRCEYHKYKHKMCERKRKATRRMERISNTRRMDENTVAQTTVAETRKYD
jgi:hypothetical protein